MKKTYKRPETRYLDAEMQQMIALSKINEEADPNGEVLGRDSYEMGDGQMYQHHSVWED